MTTYEFKATEEEARDIMDHDKRFVFRSSNREYYLGDIVHFHVVKAGKMKPDPIERAEFEVVYASKEAPVQSGFTVIGLRRTR